MSTLRINNITDRLGQSGTDIVGVSTVASTSSFVVPAGDTAHRGGRGKGIQGGGSSDVTVMDYVEIATEANAIDFGDLTVGRRSLGSVSSSTRGVFMGGLAGPAWVNTID